MKIILSIKPKFAEKIFDGSKRFEFRRSVFKNPNVNSVIVYASAPISKVIGEFQIEQVLHDEINSLWSDTAAFSGISKEYFDTYFTGKDKGYAIQIKKTKLYKQRRCLKSNYGISPPQSFAYEKKNHTLQTV